MGPDGVSYLWYAAGVITLAVLVGVVPPGYPVRRIVVVSAATLLGAVIGLVTCRNVAAVWVFAALTATAALTVGERTSLPPEEDKAQRPGAGQAAAGATRDGESARWPA
jgi:hypothetical protein